MNIRIIWIIVIIFLIISAFAPSIIQLLFKIGDVLPINLSNSFRQTEILDFWGSSLGALATVFLGALALFQNKILKDENEKAQEKLHNAVNKIAEANEILAKNNIKLISLEEQNQRIQLLLAQKLIPFLELTKYEKIDNGPCTEPRRNSYIIRQTDPIREGVHDGQKRLRQIEFNLEISKFTTLYKYISILFILELKNYTESKLAYVEIISITFSNSRETESIILQELNDQPIPTPNFMLSEWAIFSINIILSDDYLTFFNSAAFKLFFELKMITTTGVSYIETILIDQDSFSQNQTVKYQIEPI